MALAVTLHEARMGILQRAGEQPQLVEAVRKAARSSAEWAATKTGKALLEAGAPLRFFFPPSARL